MQLNSVGETGVAGLVHPWSEAWGGKQVCPPSHPKQTMFPCGQGAMLQAGGCCASGVARAEILTAGLQRVEGLFLLGGPPCDMLHFLPGQRLGSGEGAHHQAGCYRQRFGLSLETPGLLESM